MKNVLTDGDINGYKYKIEHDENLFKMAKHELIKNIRFSNEYDYRDATQYALGNANVWEFILVMMGHKVHRELRTVRGMHLITHIYIDEKLAWKAGVV